MAVISRMLIADPRGEFSMDAQWNRIQAIVCQAGVKNLWLNAVGRKVAESPRDEDFMIVLARKCIVHAHAVNQKYFEARISADSIAFIGQIVAAIEDISTINDFPPEEVEEMT